VERFWLAGGWVLGQGGRVVDKDQIIGKIREQLKGTLEAGMEAARATTAAATDPDSKAENKYDTRNLEASYLARGQAARVVETREALTEYESLRVRDYAEGQPIGEGALVALRGGDGEFYCFVGPAAGGMEVEVDGQLVMVITRASPLGSRLLKRRKGERVEMSPGRAATAVEIVGVA
jgi:transcription elongation GreA/GreB family factor